MSHKKKWCKREERLSERAPVTGIKRRDNEATEIDSAVATCAKRRENSTCDAEMACVVSWQLLNGLFFATSSTPSSPQQSASLSSMHHLISSSPSQPPQSLPLPLLPPLSLFLFPSLSPSLSRCLKERCCCSYYVTCGPFSVYVDVISDLLLTCLSP